MEAKSKFSNYLRTKVFTKKDIVRNVVWIALSEQCRNLAWDGHSIASVIDSLINVIFRLIILLLTFPFLSIGFISLGEQLFRKIVEEIWSRLDPKLGIDRVSSSVAVIMAIIVWFPFYVMQIPIVVIVNIMKLLQLRFRPDENGKFWGILGMVALFVAIFIFMVIVPNSKIIIQNATYFVVTCFLSVLLLILGLSTAISAKHIPSMILLSTVLLIVFIIFVVPFSNEIYTWVYNLFSFPQG